MDVKYIFLTLVLATIVAGGVYFWQVNFFRTTNNNSANANLTIFRNDAGGFEFGYDSKIAAQVLNTQDFSWENYASDPGTLFAIFSIPKEFEPQTNFGDARFTVGASNDNLAVGNCFKEGNSMQKSGVETLNGIDFTVFKGTGAGAGNFYEVTSYRTLHAGRCFVVEFMIHSTNIYNYPPEAGIKEFDEGKVLEVLGEMLNSFRFL